MAGCHTQKFTWTTLPRAWDLSHGAIWCVFASSGPFIPEYELKAKQVVNKLDGMSKGFSSPYIIFFPVVSRDGMAFPINKCIREVQGPSYKESTAWRGNIVVAKYLDSNFSAMVEASMADFPILKNYLSTRPAS